MILASVLLVLQDAPHTAQEWLARMEATLWESPSAHIEAVTTAPGEVPRMQTLLERRSGGRLRIEWNAQYPEGGRHIVLVVSDGTDIAVCRRMQLSEAGPPTDLGQTRARLDENHASILRTLSSRIGIGLSMMFLSLRGRDPTNPPRSADEFAHVEDLRLGGEEHVGDRPAVTIQMRLELSLTPPASQTIWVDRERFVPLRRLITFTADEEEMTIEETTTNVVVGAEIPDDRFRIPE